MSLFSSVRPNRRLAFPFVVAFYSSLWFVFRDARIGASDRSPFEVLPRTLAFIAVATVLSYVVAVGVTATLHAESRPESKVMQSLFAPSDGALVTFAVLSLTIVAYLGLGYALALPSFVQTLAKLAGVVLGWPLIAVVVGTVAVENALVGHQLIGVEFVAVGFGVALATTWLFLLSGWVATVLAPLVGPWPSLRR